MRRLINTLIITAISALAFSCQERPGLELEMNESIVLDLSSGLTKAADTDVESFVNHIDVIIFDQAGTEPGDKVYSGRYTVNNASSLTLAAKRSAFAAGQKYYVYLIANSTLPEANYETVATYNDLVDKKQEDYNLHLTALEVADAPKYFLMDAVAKDASDSSPVVLNNGVYTDNTVLEAVLTRAAAKVVVNITASENVEFKQFSVAEGSEGGLYYVRNMPYDTYILAEARPAEQIRTAKVRTTTKTNNAYFTWNPSVDAKHVSLVTYVYPNNWADNSILEREACVVMNLPMVYTSGESSVNHYNSWYKIPMTDEKMFKRNNYYEVNITLNRPGATEESTPIELNDIYYSVEEWVEQDIYVGGDDKPRYLQLNVPHVDMYNINTDATTLEFASSSPISSIVLNEAYYINYLGNKVNVSSKNQAVYNAIKATAEDGVVSGNITIFSPFVEGDGFEESHGNAIRYMTFTVTNQDGKTQTFTVNQYPTLYITHEMGYYSYRSDFGGTNYVDGPDSQNRSGASWISGGGWSYSSTASSSVFFGSKVALGSEGNYTINYAYFRNSSSTTATTSRFSGLNNPRMYHIHVTATSSDYIVARPRLDADGYTESTADNTKLVSPSFMTASQLGATQQLTGGVNQAKAHCEQYIEVTTDGTVYDDWRLPTAAEIDIIIQHQEVSDAMATILTEGAYYCAYNTDSNGNVIYTKETGKNTRTTPVRCVRDAY